MTRRYLMAAAAAVALGGVAFADAKKPAPIEPLDELAAKVPQAMPPAVPIKATPVAKELPPAQNRSEETPFNLPAIPDQPKDGVKDAPKADAKDAAGPAAPHPLTAVPTGECSGPVIVPPPTPPKEDSSWVGGEYLFSFVKPGNVPFALGSTGTTGILGAGGRGILGPGETDYGTFAGLRLSGGRWLDDCRRLGVEGSIFLLERRSVGQRAGATAADPVLARPFFDANTGTENARLLSVPGRFNGGLAYSTSSRLWGADADAVARLTDRGAVTLDGTAGFKFLSLEESLDVRDFAQTIGTAGVTAFNGVGVTGPAVTSVHDHFSTQNRFYGASVGLRVNWQSEGWFASVAGKVALGDVHQTVNVDGTSTLSGTAPAPATVGGGLLAVNSNSGHFTRDEFAVLPEVQFRLGYHITPHLAVTAGYQYQYLSNVVRPGDQLDRTINPTRVPTDPSFGVPFGPARPGVPFRTTDFWMHGATVGLMGTF